MDEFSFEELLAEMLGITDEQREDDCYIENMLYEKFNLDFDDAYKFAKELILYTPPIKAGAEKNNYHAFISRKHPMTHMRILVSIKNDTPTT